MIGTQEPGYTANSPSVHAREISIHLFCDHIILATLSTSNSNKHIGRANHVHTSVGTGSRTLDISWIVHNFIRKHFTIKQVPAVALGILEKGLSWG
jgi:hypothetical protein